MSKSYKHYQTLNRDIYEINFNVPIILEEPKKTPFTLDQDYNQEMRIYNEMKHYVTSYRDKDIDSILVIKRKPQIGMDINQLPNMPDELTIFKYPNGLIHIKLSNYPGNTDIRQLSNIIGQIPDTLYYEDNNTIMISNINTLDLYKLMEKLMHPFENVNNVPMTISMGVSNLEIRQLKNNIYQFVFGTDNIDELLFKYFIFNDYQEAMRYLNKHPNVLPLFVDIVYFDNHDTRYDPILHQYINKVIVDDQLLNLFTDDEIKKIYYVLAQIIMSNQELYNTNQGKLAILEYLFKSDDFMDSQALRNRIAYNIMGYQLGQGPGFDINGDTQTVLNLLKMIGQMKK